MSVWYCIPSARPKEETERIVKAWNDQGYKVALYRDFTSSVDDQPKCDMLFMGHYPGYAVATNTLAKLVFERDKDCDWIVAGGDDILPDPNHSAIGIARECSDHFRNRHIEATGETFNVHPTFGVMQPTGDKDFGDAQGPYIERVCGSPWLGREFCRRINQGNGPFWPDYFHMGSDEELQAVATKLGVLWQRPDLKHYHSHWGRPREGEKMGSADRMPDFLKRANSPAEWAKYKRIFQERQAAGFPGSEPL
jgi:hypothetical protein